VTKVSPGGIAHVAVLGEERDLLRSLPKPELWQKLLAEKGGLPSKEKSAKRSGAAHVRHGKKGTHLVGEDFSRPREEKGVGASPEETFPAKKKKENGVYSEKKKRRLLPRKTSCCSVEAAALLGSEEAEAKGGEIRPMEGKYYSHFGVGLRISWRRPEGSNGKGKKEINWKGAQTSPRPEASSRCKKNPVLGAFESACKGVTEIGSNAKKFSKGKLLAIGIIEGKREGPQKKREGGEAFSNRGRGEKKKT